MPRPIQVLKKVQELNKPLASAKYMVNRNPRNLERLRIAYKPDGYHLEKPGRCFWHKLEVVATGKYVTAKVVHFENGPVVEASTSEWCIKKQLFKPNDTSAYMNLARVFAQRCIQTGLTEMRSDSAAAKTNGKLGLFLKTLESNGISLQEPDRYLPDRPWSQDRPEKPWEVVE